MDRQLLSQKSSNNLRNENIKPGVFREMIFQKKFILAFKFIFGETLVLMFSLLRLFDKFLTE